MLFPFLGPACSTLPCKDVSTCDYTESRCTGRGAWHGREMQGAVFRGRTKKVSWLLRSLLTCLGVFTFNVTLLWALPLTGCPPQVLGYRDSASGARLMTPATAPHAGQRAAAVLGGDGQVGYREPPPRGASRPQLHAPLSSDFTFKSHTQR